MKTDRRRFLLATSQSVAGAWILGGPNVRLSVFTIGLSQETI